MNSIIFSAILTFLLNGVLVACLVAHDEHVSPRIHSGQYLKSDTSEYQQKNLFDSEFAPNPALTLDIKNAATDKLLDTSNTYLDEFNSGNEVQQQLQPQINLPFFEESDKNLDQLAQLEKEIKEDEDIAAKSTILLKLLQEMPKNSVLPIIYVEEDENDFDGEDDEINGDYYLTKRSGRYYRRYPWKRQNSRSRSNYDPESRYLCVPSRDDVFKLLVGLHENRKGNIRKTVNFCNRKRQAKQIFTHIRFLG